MRILITLALLFSFAFSTVHEYAFAFYDESHCDVAEFVSEMNAPSEHNDICDTHFEYHHTYILSSKRVVITQININDKPFSLQNTYSSSNPLDLVIPPTS